MKVTMTTNKKTGVKEIAPITKSQAKKLGRDANIALSVVEIMEKANSLYKERENFENVELARSNKALYAILTKVYMLFNNAIAGNCMKETVLKMKEELKNRGTKIQTNTPALTLFVRYIFNSDRKRSYNYASTLMAAVQADVLPENLAAFIEGKNGVEECKKEYKKKEETILRERAIVEASNSVIDSLATMSSNIRVTLPNASVDFSDGSTYSFILARSLSDGEFELLRVIPKSTKGMENTAIKELAKDLIVQTKLAEENMKKSKVKSTTSKAVGSMTAKAAAKMSIKELEAA